MNSRISLVASGDRILKPIVTHTCIHIYILYSKICTHIVSHTHKFVCHRMPAMPKNRQGSCRTQWQVATFLLCTFLVCAAECRMSHLDGPRGVQSNRPWALRSCTNLGKCGERGTVQYVCVQAKCVYVCLCVSSLLSGFATVIQKISKVQRLRNCVKS